jgi:hypothetical protein
MAISREIAAPAGAGAPALSFEEMMRVQALELERGRLALEQARFGLEQRRQGFEERRFAHTFALEQAQAVRLHRCTSLRDFYAPVQPDGAAQAEPPAQSAPADCAASPADDAAPAAGSAAGPADPAPVRPAGTP